VERVTAIQLAQRLGVDYVVAASLLKLMVSKGEAKEVGKVKTSLSGKGKPSTVYEIPGEFKLTLSAPAVQSAA
jgi:hypothetical protein